MCMWHVHKTETFRYPINDVIRGKELVKMVLVALPGKVLSWNCYKINKTLFKHKTFNADHVRLTSSEHTRDLASKGENL